MRRPLKPFVTEYKASNRRPPTSPGEQGLFESERPAPKPFDFMLKAEPEDSYDAAMRAADALFSIPAADHEASEQPPNGGSHTDPSHPERNVGRILRVIDEEPPPEYAALEAEHAPKRRGRKPGSKNKPKVIVTALADEIELSAPIWKAPIHTPAPIVAAPTMPAARKIPAIASNAVLANSAPAGAGARNGTRFSWVRDRLKPGEDWKRRRLPRICW